MGTKNNPGDYDCYAKLEPDEPFFVLRGKDPVAPFLVMAWAASRRGDLQGVADCILAMGLDTDVQSRVSGDDYDKLEEARSCAQSMREWRRQKEEQDKREELDAPADIT